MKKQKQKANFAKKQKKNGAKEMRACNKVDSSD